MKRILAAAAVLLALGGSAVAQQRGYVTTDVNLRAGPGTAYPVVVILEGGTPLGIYGCIDDYSWCDVDWRGNRGWIAARYLGYDYRGRRVDFYEYAPTIGVPIVAFSFDDYWGRYYRGRSWYSNYDRWGPPPPRGYRPPPYGGPGYGPGYGPPPPGWNGGGRPPPPPPGGNWVARLPVAAGMAADARHRPRPAATGVVPLPEVAGMVVAGRRREAIGARLLLAVAGTMAVTMAVPRRVRLPSRASARHRLLRRSRGSFRPRCRRRACRRR